MVIASLILHLMQFACISRIRSPHNQLYRFNSKPIDNFIFYLFCFINFILLNKLFWAFVIVNEMYYRGAYNENDGWEYKHNSPPITGFAVISIFIVLSISPYISYSHQLPKC